LGHWIKLKASDGHELDAWRDGPDDAEHYIVLGMELFGVNSHIRYACAQFAAQGFAVIAPALLDRAERGVEMGYSQEELQYAFKLRDRVPRAGTLADLQAARAAFPARKVGIIGYCWGGRAAWWGATSTNDFSACVTWYGGGIAADKDEKPRCPVQMHFGEHDHAIPLSDVEAIRLAQPNVEIFVYPGAQHGFGCEERPMFDQASYDLAQARTLKFFRQHLK
jgi:carboxymethylenebutenolidase